MILSNPDRFGRNGCEWAGADSNSRILGAGVSQVAFTTVTVSGITATIVARAHEWTSSVVRQHAGGNWLDVSPAADTIYNAKLSIGPSGTWLATDMIGRLANGSGPWRGGLELRRP
jgi:hypothetical protein